ncbi:MAG: SCO family protein [Hyphomonadaceae bacterium]|nr:SCO family protein [Hyphomonadaceae bacterium]
MTTPSPLKPAKPVKLYFVYVLVISVLASVWVWFWQSNRQAEEAQLPANCKSRAFAEIGGPFNLVNQDGVAVSEKTFLGKPALIYFGFTYCPDVCPLSLQSMALSLEAAKDAGGRNIEDIQPILITLDPVRDTPQALKNYVTSGGFPPRLIGLTGSVEQVNAAAKAFKVAHTKTYPKATRQMII